MKNVFAFLFCALFSYNVPAQNLVPNGSFEDYYSCPISNGQADTCVGWFGMGGVGDPLPGTPDYFNACAPYVANVPDNFAGYQSAFKGNAYMGLYTYHWPTFWREIIGANLIDTLIIGNSYNASMRVSRGNHTFQANNSAASNRMGIRFSNVPFSKDNPPPIDNFAHLHEDSIITDTSNWVLLYWHFVADSEYSHVYIGNFFDDENTDIITYGPYPADAYYFIDSVNIECVSENCMTGIENIDNDQLIQFDGINRIKFEQDGHLLIYALTGQEVLNRNINSGNVLNTDVPTGIYILLFSNEENSISQKIFLYSP